MPTIQAALNVFRIDNDKLTNVIYYDAKRCYFGDAPTLAELNAAYPLHDQPASVAILYPHVCKACESLGAQCIDKPQAYQIRELCMSINADYFWLKITEVLLFLRKAQQEEYGSRFGTSVCAYIKKSVPRFLQERARSIEERAHEKAKEERGKEANDPAKQPVPWDVYCEMTGQQDRKNDNPLNKIPR